MSDSLWPHGLYSPWNSPGQNTGVGSPSLLQGIEPGSPALQVDSLPTELSGKHKPREKLTLFYLTSGIASYTVAFTLIQFSKVFGICRYLATTKKKFEDTEKLYRLTNVSIKFSSPKSVPKTLRFPLKICLKMFSNLHVIYGTCRLLSSPLFLKQINK